MGFIELLVYVMVLFSLCIILIYIYFKYKYKHWKNHGIPEVTPTFPFGCFWEKNSMGQIVAKISADHRDKKVVGIYLMSKPVLLVNDIGLAKSILVKDFSSFHNRGFEINTDANPMIEHLFFLKSKEWRNLRIKLTPTFTSGKMKMMFPTLTEVGTILQKEVLKYVNEPEIEIKDLLSRYTMDVIASCAFGIETNCLENPDSKFRQFGLTFVKPTIKMQIMMLILFAFPGIAKKINISLVDKEISDFFLGLVRDTMDYREKNNVKRNDFMQLLLQIKNLGYVADADSIKEKSEEIDTSQKFTVEQAAAQAFLFFFAGFETSSSTMQFALYELALNFEIQKRLQKEIDDNIAKNNGTITYEGVHEMDYLDMVVSETLRKYPIGQALVRLSNNEYRIPDTEYTIPSDTSVMFPVYAYHHDPAVYPDPEKFDPDRFLPEEKEKRDHFSYLPFGEGPRSCIGNRFALMQVKAGLIVLLSKFNFEVSKNTQIPMVFDPSNDMLTPIKKLNLKVVSRF